MSPRLIVASLYLMPASGCSAPTEPRPPSDPPTAPRSVTPPAENEDEVSQPPSASKVAAPEVAETPAANAHGVSEQEVQALCTEILDDDELEIGRCSFASGHAIAGGGRIDIVVVEFEEPGRGEVRVAHLVLRGEEGTESVPVGESFYVAGQEEDYRLGELTVAGNTAQLRAYQVTTTFPNTGEPDADPQEEVETTRVEVRCVLTGDDAGCERELFEESP